MVSIQQDVEVGSTQPPDPSIKVGPGPSGIPGRPPKGYVPLANNERTAAIGKVAVSLLGGEWGALTPFRVGNKKYMARVEPHYHPPPPAGASPEEQKKYPKPWGWHKGVTVYKEAATGKDTEEKKTSQDFEEVTDKPTSGRISLLQRIDEMLSQIGGKG